ncbi:hypothetical protein KSF_093930 [Reticulibacter mediterranei]|uniref:ABM domain-containing protein n=1 Tax=Reticulibacter mediterranei TaxID=2778369 RepID=A0A8J3IYX8_9CHLR|nr:hypothetical protein [Reticulibacter mediterranei]GHO99345.1 hypothetical protein KSF_093930 [Reticulibacter mediterranei]
MISITHATYTVQAAYAEQNKSRIARVIEELRALQRTDLQYSVFVQDDGKTFIHMLLCTTEDAHKAFGSLEAFAAFQRGLEASQPEVLPSVNRVTLVGSTTNVLS